MAIDLSRRLSSVGLSLAKVTAPDRTCRVRGHDASGTGAGPPLPADDE
jgi:hypothetical protein